MDENFRRQGWEQAWKLMLGFFDLPAEGRSSRAVVQLCVPACDGGNSKLSGRVVDYPLGELPRDLAT
jgi:hypothetical protein